MKAAAAILAVVLVALGVFLFMSTRKPAPAPRASTAPSEQPSGPLPSTVSTAGPKKEPVAFGTTPPDVAHETIRRHDIQTEVDSLEHQLASFRDMVARHDKGQPVSPTWYAEAQREIPKIEARLKQLHDEQKP